MNKGITKTKFYIKNTGEEINIDGVYPLNVGNTVTLHEDGNVTETEFTIVSIDWDFSWGYCYVTVK